MSNELANFGVEDQQMLQQKELNTSALVAQAQAQVQAKYLMAKKFPRDIDLFRQKLLSECKRPGFAGTALYRKPQGKDVIIGPSIRFAETCIRLMRNIQISSNVVFDDADSRTIHVVASDIENNTHHEGDVFLQKTVERKFVKNESSIISKRYNSKNELVYIVRATEDELLTKQNALISKQIRESGLRLIPADIVSEALDLIKTTQKLKDAEDPDTARKKVFDAFFSIGIGADQLKEYLDHEANVLSQSELQELREIYQSLNDKETTWKEIMDSKFEKPKTTTQEKDLFNKTDEVLTDAQKIIRIRELIGEENIIGLEKYLVAKKILSTGKTLQDIDIKYIDSLLLQSAVYKAKAIEYLTK